MRLRDLVGNPDQTGLVRATRPLRRLRSNPVETVTDPRPPGMFMDAREAAGLVVGIVVYYAGVVVMAYALPGSWHWAVRGAVALVSVTALVGVGLGVLVALDNHDVIDLDDDYDAEFWGE